MPLLERRLATRKVTLLTGARQTGKTTLVRDILPRVTKRDIAYFSLDNPDERILLKDNPVARLDQPGKLIVLDEIQKLPELMDVVKLLVDRPAARNKDAAKFLLLGSSQILLLKKVRESLAGRVTILSLWPLAVGERVRTEKAPPIGMDKIAESGKEALDHFIKKPPSAAETRALRKNCDFALEWGGFPPVEHLENDEERRIWLRDYRNTYLERDLADLGRVADLDQFAKAQSMFAARTGHLFSYSEIGRDLGVSVPTVKKYLRFLEISYQTYLLQPFFQGVAKRLIKSPKLYWLDVGLARVLSQKYSLGDGALFETFVAGEIIKWLSWQTEPPHFGYHRTRAGAEVDFVLWNGEFLIAIEAKVSANVHQGDAGGISRFFRSLPAGYSQRKKLLGLAVYRGRTVRRLRENIWAVPDWLMFGGIRES
ncbi:MAG TPA: ATP-binding protein [Terriglobales bacterium]|nr:ATP-binding protein [Terriglobales bacterium]